jgi:hypothetical protein
MRWCLIKLGINLPLSLLTAGEPQNKMFVVLKVLDEDVQQILKVMSSLKSTSVYYPSFVCDYINNTGI